MTKDAKKSVRTIILGAGFGGLGMAAELKRAGDNDFIIFERASDLGGVWRDNSYPGAACDIEARLYCYSFFPNLGVSRMFAGRDELMDYIRRLARHFDLEKHIHFDSEITKAEWNETKNRWDLTINGTDHYNSSFFIPAWGQLNNPVIPDFKGFSSFKGKSFHSGAWDHSIDLKGKRVGSVGAAASAVQYVPEVAKEASHLTVFQRNANWIVPRGQTIFAKEELEEISRKPEIFNEIRNEFYALREAGFTKLRRNSKAQQEAVEMATAHMHAQIPDPVLREKLTPNYELGCKRILRTDDYYPALMRDNVELETSPIDHFSADGIVTADGVLHPCDVVIFGTGFASQAFQGNLEIIGCNGKSLNAVWDNGAEAYLGMSVPDFPNMFVIYGPNTNLNHNSIIAMMEIQQNYIVEAIKTITTRKAPAVAVRPDICAAFNAKLQDDMKDAAFSANCSSWYKNADGKIINNWSGTVDDYRNRAKWSPEDYRWLNQNEAVS